MTKADVLDVEFEAAVEPIAVEQPEHERVQAGEERDLGRARHCIAQRDRAMRGQLGHEPVGDRAETLVFLRRRVGAIDDDLATTVVLANGGDAVNGAAIAVYRSRLRLDRQLILSPNIAALDAQAAIGRDADERAGARQLVGIVSQRPPVECLDGGLKLAQALVDLVGKLLRILMLGAERVVLGLSASRVACSSAVISTGVPRSWRNP